MKCDYMLIVAPRSDVPWASERLPSAVVLVETVFELGGPGAPNRNGRSPDLRSVSGLRVELESLLGS